MKLKFTVSGMTCAACSARVEKVTKAVPGVQEVQVNLLSGVMQVEADSDAVTEQIVKTVLASGYGAVPEGEGEKSQNQATKDDLRPMKKRIVASLVFLLTLMYFTMGHMLSLPVPSWYHGRENILLAALLQCFLTLPVVVLNRSYYLKGFKAMLHRAPNMDSLIAVGSGAALVYGVAALFRLAYAMGHGQWEIVEFYSNNLYFESAAMILTLITVGKYLEARAKGKTGDAIRALMNLRPKTAQVIRDGREFAVLAQELRVSDVVVVRSGGAIAVDGIVLRGHGSVDQSALTGESVPVEVQSGDAVSAATVLTAGYLEIRAERVGEDTTLQQVIRMVEQAGGSKAPIARMADKIAGVFVPVVMAISLISFAAWMLYGMGLEFSLTSAISVLVISCPCALGLATPVAIMVGTGRGASMGVLFRNGEALEHLHRVDTVVLDKTGTLTVGKPAITDVFVGQASEQELLSVAGALEKPSEHPFAKAVTERVKDSAFCEVQDFETLPGLGVSGIVQGIRYYGGNRKLMEREGIALPQLPDLEKQGKTFLFFGDENGRYLGALVAADVLKPDSEAAVAQLHKMGLKVFMLTGDNKITAQSIAKAAGITDVMAEVLPTDKAQAVKNLMLQGRRVLMVGDGINDAPALVTADVGMAIGAGTDIAVSSADVVLMSGSLMGIANAIGLSKATVRNIRQNLFWAFFYNCLGIPLAAGALYLPFGIQLSPMLGAAAMSLSSVFVVTNALRLRRFRLGPFSAIKKEEERMSVVIYVDGMMCGHCKAMVERVCKGVAGTEDAVVDLQTKSVTVTGKPDVPALKRAITDAGYTVVEEV